jgi:moderate conductance mechanosensitive channel
MGEWLDKLWTHLGNNAKDFLKAEQWAQNVQHLVVSLIIIVIALLATWLARRFLRRVETRVERMRGIEHRRKIETITSLVASTIKYAVYIASAMAILVVWGAVDPASLAFGSAAIGAAIGFGSQGLVQDIITGLSILAEDQLAVGDYVEVGGKAGVVEEIGLRVIKLRDHFGVQHVIFNRNIASVSNYTSGAVQAIVDISLEKAEDGDAARRVATKVCADMAAELPYFPDVPEVEGVRQSSTNDIFLRLHLRVLPQQQDTINQLFVDRIKRAFAGEKLVIPEGRVRVIIISDLFKRAIGRVKPSALPASSNGTYEGAV